MSLNMGAKEASLFMGISVRQVYRHGACLGQKRFGKAVRFDRQLVTLAAEAGFTCDCVRKTVAA